MKFLIVEDDPETAKFIKVGLEQEAHQVEWVANGIDGLNYAQHQFYDFIILDVMLPGRNGFSVLEHLRKDGVETPIIILSAQHSVENRVRGLELGADDYLVKPFAFRELMARIQAVGRRGKDQGQSHQLQVGDLRLDLLSRNVHRGQTEITLQKKEFELLAYLMKNSGNVVSKTMILDRVWDYQFQPGSNVIEAVISKLREKIDKPFEQKYIHTVHGSGYCLKAS